MRGTAFVWQGSSVKLKQRIRGRVWNGLMHIVDILPSIVSGIAGLPLAAGKDGLDVWAALVGNKTSPRREALLQLSVRHIPTALVHCSLDRTYYTVAVVLALV